MFSLSMDTFLVLPPVCEGRTMWRAAGRCVANASSVVSIGHLLSEQLARHAQARPSEADF